MWGSYRSFGSDSGPDNAWLNSDKPQWDPDEIDLEKKLLDSAHYNPIINLETMTLTQVRVMLAYTYLLAIGAIVFTYYAGPQVDQTIHVFVLNPLLAIGYLVFALWFIKNCCCDCVGLWRGRTKRVREQAWILFTLFICALCAGEFVVKTFHESYGFSKEVSIARDRMSKIIAGAVLTSALKFLWLLLMDSFGRMQVHECGFFLYKLLFAGANATVESLFLIKGYSPYGRQVMITTWVFYGIWFIWLLMLMVRTARALEEYSYIQTRMRQLGFRFFCFQTTAIMTSIIACLGINAYREEQIVTGYQMVAHGYMLLLGWCYIPLPASESLGKLKTLETEITEAFEHLSLPRDAPFEVSKMCLMTSWEVYHMLLDDTNPFRRASAEEKAITAPPDRDLEEGEDLRFEPKHERFRIQQIRLTDSWKKMGGWSVPNNIRPRVINIVESDEHIRCLVAELQNPRCLIIAFRGTANYQNMLTDCAAWRVSKPDFGMMSTENMLEDAGVYIHSGFWSAYMSIRTLVLAEIADYINPKIDDLKAPDPVGAQDIPIICTGHSLGGALACLAALDFATLRGFKQKPPSEGGRLRSGFETGCITFGQPRVGNRAFARLVEEKVPSMVRVVYERDIVTGQPSIPLLYKHAGLEAVVDDKGNCIPDPSFVEKTFLGQRTNIGSHSLKKYLEAYNSNVALINKFYARPPQS